MEQYTIEQIKKAFYEEFSGSGECWFGYINGYEIETKADEDKYVDTYFEDFLEILNRIKNANSLGEKKYF